MSFWKDFFGATSPNRFSRKSSPGLKENLQAFRYLPRFLKMVWETHRGYTLANLILRVMTAGIPLATLYVGKLIIDEVVALAQGSGGDTEMLWIYVGVELGLALASSLLSRAIALIDALLGDLFNNQTSEALMAHAASLDLPQFEDAEFYDKMERARRQTTGRIVLMGDILRQLQDIITMFFLGAGLIVFSPWLIFLLVVAVIPSFISETWFNRQSYSLARNWTPERRELDYLRYLGASDQTAKEVKIFGLSDFLRKRFSEVAHRYYLANRRLATRRAVWGFTFNSLGDIGYYAAYVVIILRTIQGQITIGDLTFLAGSFSRLRGTLQGILSRFSKIANSALYLQDLFDFFAMQPAISNSEQPRPFPRPIQKGFVFENVGFHYPGAKKWAIRNLSFHLRPGEKLALVGENGAGKTTLVKLLARLYDPVEGRILLDGQDLRDYDLQDLRRQIGVIFQDYVRFQMRVSENIAVGHIEEIENRPMIAEAARLSLADTVVEELPEGLDQMLGRRFGGGVELSGGQWQKIALGRAYMREAQLLILDEPTAALDARAEYEVFERFAELTKGKSAVLISHRFSTVRMADRILVLENGTLQEIGTHEELLEKDGTYAALFHLQAQGYL